MSTNPIVMTSINPFSRLHLQVRCFKAWKAAGFNIQTANTGAEADLLEKSGLSKTDIIILAPEETGQALFGRPVPKVMALLGHLSALCGDTRYGILTNSDIYPALRNTKITDYWAMIAPVVALTREETPLLETIDYESKSPYRQGLDIFGFQAGSLGNLIACLREYSQTERMCFGIPGWDYLMGAITTSDRIRGRILDSGVLFHESHPTTYGSIEEFGHFLPVIRSLTGVKSTDIDHGAREYAAYIDAACRQAREIALRGKIMFFRPPESDTTIDPESFSIAMHLHSCCTMLFTTQRQMSVARVVQDALQSKSINLTRAQALFLKNPDPQFQFTQMLASILLVLLCRQAIGSRKPTSDYPAGNLHKKALQGIIAHYANAPAERNIAISQLFGAELIDHNIFNPRLYNYLVLCCKTDADRRLLRDIFTCIERSTHAA